MKLAVTGANGHLGRRLIEAVAGQHEVRALVRSERAAATLRGEFGPTLAIHIVDYASRDDLAQALAGVEVVVHLVGIIKQSKSNPFREAHENACQALADAAADAGVRRIVCLGIVGTDDHATNECFVSRANAEAILLAGSVPAFVLRVPMVLGEDDYASAALGRQARKTLAFTFRAGSLEQPIFAGDVTSALVAAIETTEVGIAELAGPESLTRRELVQRASRSIGVDPPTVISLPIGVGLALAAVFELFANPPVTRAMLGVLDHDDAIDPAPTAARLGIALTPLDDALGKVLAKPAN